MGTKRKDLQADIERLTSLVEALTEAACDAEEAEDVAERAKQKAVDELDELHVRVRRVMIAISDHAYRERKAGASKAAVLLEALAGDLLNALCPLQPLKMKVNVSVPPGTDLDKLQDDVMAAFDRSLAYEKAHPKKAAPKNPDVFNVDTEEFLSDLKKAPKKDTKAQTGPEEFLSDLYDDVRKLREEVRGLRCMVFGPAEKK